jgi:histidinol-phosphate aminotransferase
MPTIRADVREISPYKPGRPIADVAAEYGFSPDDIVKLASNERPTPPLPEVIEAVTAAAGEANR